MRAVVTGGAGFIGSNLVDALLARGDDVTVVDNFATGKRENVNAAATLLEHDIREPFSVEADVVFHLAAQADVQTSMQRPDYDAAVNVVGTVNVLDAVRRRTGDLRLVGRRGLRRVHRARRRAVAVPAAVALRHREEVRRGVPRRLEPHPRHARTSRSASRTSTARARTPVSRAASSRSSSSAWRAATRRSSSATALHSRDFVYVGDIVAALLATVGHSGGPYNVGTGQDTTVAQLHAACARVAGSDAAPRHEAGPARRRAALRARLAADRARARLVGRDVSLDDGLARTWAWMQEHAARVAKRVALWTRHSMHPTP